MDNLQHPIRFWCSKISALYQPLHLYIYTTRGIIGRNNHGAQGRDNADIDKMDSSAVGWADDITLEKTDTHL